MKGVPQFASPVIANLRDVVPSVCRARATKTRDVSPGEIRPILIILATARENFYASPQFARQSRKVSPFHVDSYLALIRKLLRFSRSSSMTMGGTDGVQRACNIARPSNRNSSRDSQPASCEIDIAGIGMSEICKAA